MIESDNSELEIHEPVAFGQQLMLAREKAGMTLDEAARALNLKEEIVEAIEDSDLARLPPVAFVKGYIRTYAKLLDLSEENIMSKFEEEVPHEVESKLHPRSALPDEADSQTPVIKLISAVIIVSAVAVLIYAIYSYYIEKTGLMEQAGLSDQDDNTMQLSAEATMMQQQTEIAPADTLIGQAQTGAGQIEFSEIESSEVETSELETGEVQASDVEAVEFMETAAESVAVAETLPQQDVESEMVSVTADEGVSEDADEKIMPVPIVAPITGGDVLTVSAEQESWAEIVDANDIRLFYGMIKPGRDLRLTGQTPFDIFLGNAPVVSLSLNATSIDMTKYVRSNNIAQFKVSIEEGRIRFHQ
jgi:cytoskeleton protein RodZ